MRIEDDPGHDLDPYHDPDDDDDDKDIQHVGEARVGRSESCVTARERPPPQQPGYHPPVNDHHMMMMMMIMMILFEIHSIHKSSSFGSFLRNQ